MKRRIIRLLAVLFLSVSIVPNVSQATSFSNIYFLGDSLSDVGNLFLATGGQVPQASDYYMGRFSNGPSYTEHLWQNLGMPGTLTPSFAGGTNFAVGGARSRYHAFDWNPLLNPGFSDPLSDMTAFSSFTLLGQSTALLSGGTLDPAALYTVWIGSNDVADAFEAVLVGGGSSAAQAYAGNLLLQSANDLADVINDLVGAGAKKLLVPTVPNLGLVPEVIDLLPVFAGAQALATSLSQTFNNLVDSLLAGVSAEITRLDTFDFLTELVGDPTLFGLSNISNKTDACFDGFVGDPGTTKCANPDEYLFWDKIHPSAVTHTALGRLAANAVPEPTALVLLSLGFVGLGFARKRVAS